MKESQYIWVKCTLSVIVVILAFVRFVFYETVSERMDTSFYLLIAAAFLILLIPWERLKSIKAGGVELTLSQPQVRGAICSLIPEIKGRVADKHMQEQFRRKLRRVVSRMSQEIEEAKGSRILWIDDKPHNIVGERRLLRALGVEVVTALSSEIAEEILAKENDFDMIISDVQRKGESYKLNNGVPIHEGTNFVVKLRRDKDPVIKALPVTFYAAYEWDRLAKFTKPARTISPGAEFSNSIDDLLVKVFDMLSEARSNPIEVRTRKGPTSIRETGTEL